MWSVELAFVVIRFVCIVRLVLLSLFCTLSLCIVAFVGSVDGNQTALSLEHRALVGLTKSKLLVYLWSLRF